MLNNEPNYTYTFGWKVLKDKSNLDITNDIIKPYYKTNALKVHLDNNIIEPNTYYNFKFYI
jgi:hypothetical protein